MKQQLTNDKIMKMIWVALIAGVMALTLSGIIMKLNNLNIFNPETDVCDECNDGSKSVEYSNCYLENKGPCIKWHHKDKCGLNPTEEGCVCDETKEWTQVYRNDDSRCNELTFDRQTEEILWACSMCIKAHTPICKEVCE